MNYKPLITGIFVLFAVVELWRGKLLQREETTRKDVIIELVSGLVLPLATVPTIFILAPKAFEFMFGAHEGALESWPWWVMFGVLLVADDLTQYWWHRLSHMIPALYRLHRAHHSARYMSVRIVYRNNLLYYAMMPGLWLSGILVYLGFGKVYVVYVVLKMLVISGAHSSVAWDEPLLRTRWGRVLFWFLARTISTPLTHSAHHGRHATDGVTYYKGNFGNFLFLWDVIFGTAKISERRPPSFGLENVRDASWSEELLWPIARDR